MSSSSVHRAGVAGITVALLTSSAITAGAGSVPVALANETGVELQAADAAAQVEIPVYPAERDDWDYCVTMGVPGTYDATGAQALLDRVNEIRAEAAAQGITVNGVPVSGAPLAWSTDLEFAAQVRAVEATMLPYHWRTVGIPGAFYRPNNTFAADILDENIAWAADTAAALDAWYAEKDAYLAYLATGVDTGDFTRYVSLISDDFAYIGIGSFAVDPALGVTSKGEDPAQTTLVALFANELTQVGAPARPDGACVQQVNVAIEFFAAQIAGEATVPYDASAQLEPHVWMRQTIEPEEGMPVEDVASMLALTWTSSNPAIVQVDENGGVFGVMPGTATVTVSCQGIRLASFDVTVSGILEVTAPAPVVTESGTAPVLAPTVTAYMENGDVLELPVAWNQVEPEQYSALEGGSFEVTGAVQGWQDAVVTVTVNPALPVEAAGLETATEVIVAPALPETTQVTWSNGDVTTETVTWDPVGEDQLAQAGTFVATGTAANGGVAVACTVTVNLPTVVEVERPVATTDSGTAPVLPQTLTAQMSNGTTQEIAVTWEDLGVAAFSAREGGPVLVGSTSFDAEWDDPVMCLVEVAPATPVEAAAPAGLTVEVAVQPVLPATVDITWSNGDVTTETVAWESYDAALLDALGELVITGVAGETGVSVAQAIEVVAPTIVSVEQPAAVTTPAGTAPTLPATAHVTWSNGAQSDDPVVWDEIDPARYLEGGQFETVGTVQGAYASQAVACEVLVEPAFIEFVDALEPVTIESGTLPALPQTVGVTMSNGTRGEAALTWYEIDQAACAAREGGTFTVAAEVEGAQRTTVLVTVNPAYIVDVAAPATVAGTAGDAPALPATVEVTWSNGDASQEAVTWNAVDASLYSAREGGSFAVEGAVEGWGSRVVAHVEVAAAFIESVAAPAAVATESAAAPALPATVEVTWSNGDASQEAVTWNAVDAALYTVRESTSFTVEGAVAGWAEPVSVQVNVEAAQIVAVADPAEVLTGAGQPPVLPATVEVTWSSGDVTQEPVTWAPVDPALYAPREGSAFSVEGTVADWPQPVVAQVAVAHATVLFANNFSTSTLEGVAPVLPSSVQIDWSNGETTEEQVVWETIDPQSFASAGTFEVAGAVGETGLALVYTVTVESATIVAVDPFAAVVIPAGTEPQLPEAAAAKMSNGTIAMLPVTWDAVDAALWTAREGATFEVAGEAATWGAVTVTVIAEPASIESVQALDGVSCEAGTAPQLPATAQVTWSNGDVSDEPVVWDEPDAALYLDGGAFTATGTVESNGSTAAVTCEVTVQDAYIAEVADPEGVSTPAGTAPVAPATATATFSNGTTAQVGVEWAEIDEASFAAREGATFEMTGTVDNWDGQVSLTVTVEPAFIGSVADPAGVTIKEDLVPELPATVEATWSNGDVTQEAVTWGDIDPIELAYPGTAFAKGTVEGWDGTVTCAVTVEEALVVSIAQPEAVTTPAGTAPQLPATVDATWDNGAVTQERVTWADVAADQYHSGGSFEVTGTIDMSPQTVTVQVTVEDAFAVEAGAVAAQTPACVIPELPATVEVTWSNGDVTQEAVTWNLVEADQLAQGATVVVEGAFSGIATNIVPTAQVSVGAPVAMDVQAPADVTTMAGIAPKLPKQAGVTMSDYSTVMFDVAWEPVDAASYAAPGSFTVSGALDGCELGPVQIAVNVTDATVQSIESVYVTTDTGTKPQLPATVDVTWSNGQTTHEIVEWEKVLGGQYSTAGTFQVHGSAIGTDITATVTVNEPAPANEGVTGVQVGIGAGILAALAAAVAAVVAKVRKGRDAK